MTSVDTRTCPKGHSDFYIPPPGSKYKSYCRVCKRESRRMVVVLCTHDGLCEPAVNVRGNRYCRSQARHCQQLTRSGVKVSRRDRLAEARAIQRPDGLEDVYGPVPLRVPDRVWVDRVALERKLKGLPVGRNMTPGENRALELLRALRRHSNGR